MRVAVLGASGQLGTDLCETFEEAGSYEVRPLNHADLDVTSRASVDQALRPFHPEVVINCAAFHRVDDCEDEVDRAFRVNALGCRNVAQTAEQMDALCVYISSDYVFDGDDGAPYRESDKPSPINVYGLSKLTGEHLLQQNCSRWLIARVASLFGKAGSSGKGGNFVETILSKASTGQPLKIVDDIRMSPTYCSDVARSLERLVSSQAQGIYHLTNEGVATWYEFACAALELTGAAASVEPTSAEPQVSKARRPRDSSLSSEHAGRDGIPRMPPWADALRRYLVEKGHLSDDPAPPT